MKKYLSNCCGSILQDYPDNTRCPECQEMCEPESEDELLDNTDEDQKY